MKKTVSISRRDFIWKSLGSLALILGGSPVKMTWAARGSDKGVLRLVFYTDVHARLEWETPKALNLAAMAINRQKADLVIAGGDLITDGFQSTEAGAAPRWDAYMGMHHAIKADLYPTMGNHDLVGALPGIRKSTGKNPRDIFLSKMGLENSYYSFRALGYHFIILDSVRITDDRYRYEGMIWAEELEWLKETLEQAPPGAPIIMVTHIPILSSFYMATEGAGFKIPKNRVINNQRDILAMIQKYNVILVLQGHLHVKELIKWRGTTFVVGGAVSGKWWRGPWHGTEEGFNVLTLRENQVQWEYVDYGWEARRM